MRLIKKSSNEQSKIKILDDNVVNEKEKKKKTKNIYLGINKLHCAWAKRPLKPAHRVEGGEKILVVEKDWVRGLLRNLKLLGSDDTHLEEWGAESAGWYNFDVAHISATYTQ